MKRLIPLILLIALTVPTLTGCFHNRVIVESNYNASAIEPDYAKNWQAFLFWGLVPLGEQVDMGTICPQGAGIVETKHSFLNGVFSLIPFVGILSFQQKEIYCAKAPKG